MFSMSSLSQNIMCTGNACDGGALTNTETGEDDIIHVIGYKCGACRTSITSVATIGCNAAFACYDVPVIQAAGYMPCSGSNSCASVPSLSSTTSAIACAGANSCTGSSLSSLITSCTGDHSCVNTNIEVRDRLAGWGAYSLLHANITSPGTNAIVDIELFGYYSGFGANITCQLGDTCNIICSGNGCYMTRINCIGDNCIVNATYATAEPITNPNEFDSSKFQLLFDTASVTISNDVKCNLETPQYDNWRHHYDGADISVTDSSICCRGESSCAGVNNINLNSIDQQDAIICSANVACTNTNENVRVSRINQNGPIFCSANQACERASIASKAVYCLADYSCRYSDINATNIVYCCAPHSCRESTIISTGNLTVYLLAPVSGQGASFYCGMNDYCTIFCASMQICQEPNIYGNIIMKYPTSSPTESPSAAPTFLPSNVPSISPSNTPSYLPSSTPTFSPSISPSIAPSLAPTISPSIYPSLTPTITPTVSPSIVPSNAPSAVPSIVPSIAPSLVPTIAPSIAPTFAPTISPSIAPSMAPTIAPSIHPSLTPTISPSNAPSKVPSISPTEPPSVAPSRNPSTAPSLSPSNDPTVAPTKPPSNAPSLAPSHSPTACVDYYNYSSLDGILEPPLVRNVIVSKKQNMYMMNESVQTFVATKGYLQNLYRQVIVCNDINTDVCFIGCFILGGCANARVKAIRHDKELDYTTKLQQMLSVLFCVSFSSQRSVIKRSFLCVSFSNIIIYLILKITHFLLMPISIVLVD